MLFISGIILYSWFHLQEVSGVVGLIREGTLINTRGRGVERMGKLVFGELLFDEILFE